VRSASCRRIVHALQTPHGLSSPNQTPSALHQPNPSPNQTPTQTPTQTLIQTNPNQTNRRGMGSSLWASLCRTGASRGSPSAPCAQSSRATASRWVVELGLGLGGDMIILAVWPVAASVHLPGVVGGCSQIRLRGKKRGGRGVGVRWDD